MAVYRGDKRNNTYRGTSRDDEIYGLGGDDVLFGMDGDDEIEGGDGNDRINGGEGDDRLWGGNGRDTLVVDYTGPGQAGSPSISTIEWTRKGYEGRLYTNSDETRFEEFEVLAVTLGRGNDGVEFDGAGLANGAAVTIDGGAGYDTLVADLSAMGDVGFVGRNATTVEVGSAGVFRNFEYFRLTLGTGTNTVTMGPLSGEVNGTGGIDKVQGGSGAVTQYNAVFNDTVGRTATWDGRDLTFTNGAFVRNVDTLYVTLGAGADTVTLSGTTQTSSVSLNLNLGAGDDRLVVGSPGVEVDAGYVLLGDGNDLVEVSGVTHSGEILGGNGADTATYMSGPYPQRMAPNIYLTFRGGTDAAVDRAVVDFSGLNAHPDPDFTINATGGVTIGTTGLNGGVGGPDIGGFSFHEVESLDVTLSALTNIFDVRVAAANAGVSMRVRGGDGVDTLRLDTRAAAGLTLTVDAAGTFTTANGTFEGFEIVTVQLGAGTNRLTLGQRR